MTPIRPLLRISMQGPAKSCGQYRTVHKCPPSVRPVQPTRSSGLDLKRRSKRQRPLTFGFRSTPLVQRYATLLLATTLPRCVVQLAPQSTRHTYACVLELPRQRPRPRAQARARLIRSSTQTSRTLPVASFSLCCVHTRRARLCAAAHACQLPGCGQAIAYCCWHCMGCMLYAPGIPIPMPMPWGAGAGPCGPPGPCQPLAPGQPNM